MAAGGGRNYEESETYVLASVFVGFLVVSLLVEGLVTYVENNYSGCSYRGFYACFVKIKDEGKCVVVVEVDMLCTCTCTCA